MRSSTSPCSTPHACRRPPPRVRRRPRRCGARERQGWPRARRTAPSLSTPRPSHKKRGLEPMGNDSDRPSVVVGLRAETPQVRDELMPWVQHVADSAAVPVTLPRRLGHMRSQYSTRVIQYKQRHVRVGVVWPVPPQPQRVRVRAPRETGPVRARIGAVRKQPRELSGDLRGVVPHWVQPCHCFSKHFVAHDRAPRCSAHPHDATQDARLDAGGGVHQLRFGLVFEHEGQRPARLDARSAWRWGVGILATHDGNVVPWSVLLRARHDTEERPRSPPPKRGRRGPTLVSSLSPPPAPAPRQ